MHSSPSPVAALRRAVSSLRAALFPRCLGALKALTYLALVSLCSLVFGARAARGAMGEVSLSLARQLHEVSDLLGSTKSLNLNGQSFAISTTVAPASAEVVLDRFAEACRSHPSELAQIAGARELGRLATKSGASGYEPLVRSDSANDGVLGCLIESANGAPRAPLREAFGEFLRTRDASVFGDFLVIYARNVGNGKSHVAAVWTRGPFKVLDLFPERGDAPGSDSTLLGRPRESRRILSAASGEEPYGVRVYETKQAPRDALIAFEKDLSSRGWARLAEAADAGSSLALRHSSGLLAIVSASASSGKTALCLMEMGTGETTTQKLARRPQ